jgi:flagellar assembly protein FliH
VSSEAGATGAFTFRQLDSPPTVREIGDALAAVHREADGLRERARAEGFAAGQAAGLAAAREQAAPALAAAAAVAAELDATRAALLAELEQDAVTLAFQLAEQILAAAIEVEPERVLDVARHALRHLSDRRQVTLVVHPDDLGLLSDSAAALAAELGGIEHLAVQADRRIGRAGAVARTESGEIDAGLGAQLSRARELVAEALAERLADAAALAAETPAPALLADDE